MFAAGRGYPISVCDRSIKDQFLATFEAARRSAKTTWNNFNTTRGLQKVGVQYDDGECRMSSTDGRIVCIASLLLWSAFLLHGICARQEDSWLKPALQKHPDVKSNWFFNAVGDRWWLCKVDMYGLQPRLNADYTAAHFLVHLQCIASPGSRRREPLPGSRMPRRPDQADQALKLMRDHAAG